MAHLSSGVESVEGVREWEAREVRLFV